MITTCLWQGTRDLDEEEGEDKCHSSVVEHCERVGLCSRKNDASDELGVRIRQWVKEGSLDPRLIVTLLHGDIKHIIANADT